MRISKQVLKELASILRFCSDANRGIAAAQVIALLSVASLSQVCPQGLQAGAEDAIRKEAHKPNDAYIQHLHTANQLSYNRL